MNRLFPLIAALLFALSSVTLGAARGQVQVAGQVILCSGSSVVSVYVDEHGQPVEHVLICPDMALSMLDAIAVPPVVLPLPNMVARRAQAVEQLYHHGLDAVPPRARGPPGVVIFS